MSQKQDNSSELKDRVVKINRVAKVVKGGRRFNFSSLVVVGDGNGKVGFGLGKASEVPESISKAVQAAKKNMIQIPLKGNTITHEVLGRFGAAKVMMKPASEGTGVIAGGAVRAIMDVAGVHDILTKIIGTNNPHNVLHATFEGFKSLLSTDEVTRLRGKLPGVVSAVKGQEAARS